MKNLRTPDLNGLAAEDSPSAGWTPGRRDFLRVVGATGLALTPGIISASRSFARPLSASTSLSLTSTTTDEPGAKVAMADYMKAHADVSFKPTYLSVGYGTLLRTRVIAGTATDIFQVGPGNGNPETIQKLTQAGALADLSGEPWVKNIPSVFRPVTDVSKKTYMFPTGIGFMSMFYNTGIFKKVGIGVPTTWNDFLSACAKIKSAGYTPIALGNQGGFGALLVAYVAAASAAYAVDPALPNKLLAGKTTFAKSGWRLAFEHIAELNKQGYFNKSVNGTSGNAQNTMFATGKAAMTPHISNAFAGIQALAPHANFSTFALPADNNAAHNWIAAGLSYGYGIYAHSKNIDAAKAFLRFLGQPNELAAYDNAAGELPFASSVPAKVVPALAPMLKKVGTGQAATYYDQLWPNAIVQTSMIQGVENLFSGQGSVDSALAAMDTAWAKK